MSQIEETILIVTISLAIAILSFWTGAIWGVRRLIRSVESGRLTIISKEDADENED